MRQVGWYDPQSCTFFNGDKDDGAHGAYSEPVYVDETPAMPPVKESYVLPVEAFEQNNNEVLFDEKSWHEIQLQTLENQYLLLKYGQCILDEIKTQGDISIPMNIDSASFTTMRQLTLSLLQKGRKLL